MMATTMLCADSASLRNSALLGLEDEYLEKQEWLVLQNDAYQARVYAREHYEIKEAWVISSDSVDGINLAAVLKHDNPLMNVYLYAPEGSGSLFGRCQAAGIIPLFGKAEFLQCYGNRKAAHLALQAAGMEKPPSSMKAGSVALRAEASALNTEEERSKEQYLSPKEHTPHDASDIDHARAEGDTEEFAIEEAIEDAPQVVTSTPSFVPHNAQKEEGKRALGAASASGVQPASQTPRIKVITSEGTKHGFVLSVVSGSGGVGKSSTTAIAAVLMQMAGLKTLLFDGDLQFGDVDRLIGVDAALDVMEICTHPERMATLEPQGYLPAVISAPPRLEQAELVAQQLPALFEALKQCFDVIVVNTGACWSDEHIHLLQLSDCSLFMVDQRPSSVRACTHVLEFCTRAGIAMQNFTYALNYISKQSFISAMDVSCALHGVTVLELSDGGRDVAELLGAGLPKELISSGNNYVESIRRLLIELIPAFAACGAKAAPSKKHGKRRGMGRKKAACL